MKKLTLLFVLLTLGCIGSDKPRNPMRAHPAVVNSKTVAPVESKTPQVKKKVKFKAPNKGCMYETMEELEKALERERKQREEAEKSKKYF